MTIDNETEIKEETCGNSFYLVKLKCGKYKFGMTKRPIISRFKDSCYKRENQPVEILGTFLCDNGYDMENLFKNFMLKHCDIKFKNIEFFNYDKDDIDVLFLKFKKQIQNVDFDFEKYANMYSDTKNKIYASKMKNCIINEFNKNPYRFDDFRLMLDTNDKRFFNYWFNNKGNEFHQCKTKFDINNLFSSRLYDKHYLYIYKKYYDFFFDD